MTQHTNKPNDASETVDAVKQTAKEATNEVQQKASEVTREAKSQAIEITEEAKDQAKSMLEDRKEMAARELGGVAEALRTTGSSLREQDQRMFANYSNRAADSIERAANYLENTNFEDLVHDSEDFARRQPELFIGGAFTLGLLAARFLKASSPSRSSRDLNYAGSSAQWRDRETYGSSYYNTGSTPTSGYQSNVRRDADDLYRANPGSTYGTSRES